MSWDTPLSLEWPPWLTRDVVLAAGLVFALFLVGAWILPSRAHAALWSYRTLVLPFLVGAFCQAQLIEEADLEADSGLAMGVSVVLSAVPGILSFLLFDGLHGRTFLPTAVRLDVWLLTSFAVQQVLYLQLRRKAARSLLDRLLGGCAAVMATFLALRVAEPFTEFLHAFIFFPD